ncbi:MAG: hypothetical protein KBC73_24410 [Burkholderiaceae bacterium]|nr:hypothetical protein [Burkholderiaceae bacterium]
MTNFVLVDAPNFVLVAAQTDVRQRCADECPDYLNPQLGALLRRLGVCARSAAPDEALELDEAGRAALRRLLRHYGFELPPLTVAELLGLLDYCDHLEALSGAALLAEHQRALWLRLAQSLPAPSHSTLAHAAGLYARGELQALRALHRAQNTLTELGRRYRRLDDGLTS